MVVFVGCNKGKNHDQLIRFRSFLQRANTKAAQAPSARGRPSSDAPFAANAFPIHVCLGAFRRGALKRQGSCLKHVLVALSM